MASLVDFDAVDPIGGAKAKKGKDSKAAAPEPEEQGWGDYLLETAKDTGVSATDTLSLGMLPYAMGYQDKVKESRERSPIATTVGDIGTMLIPGLGVSGALAKGGRAAGGILKGLASRGIGGQAANQAVTSGLMATADEAARSNVEEGREFSPGRVVRDVATGGAGGAVAGGVSSLFSPRTALTTRLPELPKGALAREAADPTGTIGKGIPVTGPEAMQAAGQPGAGKAQGLLNDMLRRAPGADQGIAAAREPALGAAEGLLSRRASDAATRARAANEGGTRVPGFDALAPQAQAVRGEISGRVGLPGGPAGPKDSAEVAMAVLDDLKARLPMADADTAAQIKQDIAMVTERLSRQGKAPAAMASREAAERGQAFDDFRQGLAVKPTGEGITQTNPLIKAGAGVARSMLPGSANMAITAAEAVPGLLQGALPTMRPAAVASALQDPAMLNRMLEPETFLEVMKRGALPQAGVRGRDALFGAVASGGHQRRRKRNPEYQTD